MFAELAPDVKRLILLRYIDKTRDFWSLSLSCRSWALACREAKPPLSCIILSHYDCGPRRTATISFRMDSRLAYSYWMSDDERIIETCYYPPHFIGESKVLDVISTVDAMAMKKTLQLLSEHRVGGVRMLLDSPRVLVNVESVMPSQPLRCRELHISGSTPQQIFELTRNIEAEHYALAQSPFNPSSELIWSKNLLQCRGRLELKDFKWQPEIYSLRFLYIDIEWTKGCGITIETLRKWGKDWAAGITYGWTEATITNMHLGWNELDELVDEYPKTYIFQREDVYRANDPSGFRKSWRIQFGARENGKFAFLEIVQPSRSSFEYHVNYSVINLNPEDNQFY